MVALLWYIFTLLFPIAGCLYRRGCVVAVYLPCILYDACVAVAALLQYIYLVVFYCMIPVPPLLLGCSIFSIMPVPPLLLCCSIFSIMPVPPLLLCCSVFSIMPVRRCCFVAVYLA